MLIKLLATNILKLHFNPFIYNVEKRLNIPLKSCGVRTARSLEHVWRFFNFMHESLKTVWNLAFRTCFHAQSEILF